MTDTIDVRIDSIAAGGDGVGRHAGLVVFVPRTAPGDVARVRAAQQQRLMRGQLESLVEPSHERVEPPCPHYVSDHCGGCQLQHLSYDAQLAAKAGIIRDALVRLGRIPVETPRVVGSDRQFRYRLKLTLALRHRGGKWIAGLHPFDAPDQVFALDDCPITQEVVVERWKEVMAMQDHFPRARQLRGALRATDSGFSFTLEGGSDWLPAARDRFFEAVPLLTELWWKPEGQSVRRVQSRVREGTGASFAQVNPGVAAELRARVLDLAATYQPTVAVDAYAGIGEYAAVLASRGARVTAIERDRHAARIAASRLPPGSRVVAASVEDALEQALPADVVIVNPPRAGLDDRVASILRVREPHPRAVIYVSCNPATLARDVRRLERYAVKSLLGYDMFPQTAHVETVCELVPAA